MISFLSDYGRDDEFVGVCHGVIARRCPDARIIDVTHGVRRHDVRAGAIALRNAIPFLPAGVHMAIVDPTVGASGENARRSVAVRTATDGQILVGPDNGLLALATADLGGAIEAVDVGRSPLRLEPVSATFHGRDIFAPVAAGLAAGDPLGAVGDPLAVEELRRLELPRARLQDGELIAHALLGDRFGNVILDAGHEQLGQAGLRLGDTICVTAGRNEHHARFATTFADVPAGEMLLYEDAQRMAALAVNRGSAEEVLGVGRDDELRLHAV